MPTVASGTGIGQWHAMLIYGLTLWSRTTWGDCAATHRRAGYWLVASDGGIFAFSAAFHGSMGGVSLNQPITGMVGAPGGYLMVAEDGGIFAFGQADFHGSLGSSPPPYPIVSVTSL